MSFTGSAKRWWKLTGEKPDTKPQYGTACPGPSPRALGRYSSSVLDLQRIADSVQAPP